MSGACIEALPPKLEQALNGLLRPGEQVHFKLKGVFKQALICTDARVIILKAGVLTGRPFGTTTFELPYSKVANVQVSDSPLGYFQLCTAGMPDRGMIWGDPDKSRDPIRAPNCIALFRRHQATKFREASSFILERASG